LTNIAKNMNADSEILPQLFRSNFSKLVAVIARFVGLEHLEVAEDIVSETFLQAAETWKVKGIPDNPTGWLYTVAKHKSHKHFKRNKLFTEKIAPQLAEDLPNAYELPESELANELIADSQLQMMFAVCNPILISEAQIGLALRILGGFGIDEIAEAFLTNKETINKRLYRAKEKLRSGQIELEMPPDNEISERLDSVLHIIYLFFNEGYHSLTRNQTLQKELCFEALRLGVILTENKKTNLPKTNALVALMCYHASRFTARSRSAGLPNLYEQQDRTLWDKVLIGLGNFYLSRSGQGTELTSYHIEAKIAFHHTQQDDSEDKWEPILKLYDHLLHINYSPVVALNRVYAIYKVHGPYAALIELDEVEPLNSHFYFTLLGELYKSIDKEKAGAHFRTAYNLAKTKNDKDIIQVKLDEL
jgi:RNA polymerase sigma factor (sigma-70 family)